MAFLATVVSVVGSLFLTPFLMFILCIIFLASIGKSLGVRRLYVKLLLTIFEYGRVNIEVANKIKRPHKVEDDEEEEVALDRSDGSGSNNLTGLEEKSCKLDSSTPSRKKNGVVNGTSQVISRDNLILVPDPVQNYQNGSQPDAKKPEESTTEVPASKETQGKLDFQLSNCLDLVKAGVEAIIEDQVTSRFEAEELKNWNLLTRTNTHYEFISWRLTVIWAFGFLVRYFFLFPLRVLICFIGVSWMVIASLMISVLPPGSIKRWLNDRAFLITFRIMARSLSVVLTFHNKELRPRRGGVCVANHTTPIDVVIVSTESSFSLVVADHRAGHEDLFQAEQLINYLNSYTEVMWLTLCTALVGYVTDGNFKTWLNRNVSIMCFGVLSSALSSVITYHNPENQPKTAGICVANHTSPIDVLVLMCDNCYSLIGQRHGGFLGILQRALARASPHIWFERSEVKDRSAVARRLKQHVSNPKNPPILIFPEGTCINNTSVMQFKKGSFEVGGVIYPVAIKYDPKFGDAFWNSSKYSMVQYLYMMMTSWAIVCDVWYLPPMYQQDGETAIDFANRVKSVIAKQGGLVDLMWDGQLKRMKPKKEWKELQQQEFSKRLKME